MSAPIDLKYGVKKIYVGEIFKISPNVLTQYSHFIKPEGFINNRNERSMANLKLRRIKNVLSDKADRKLRSAINWFTYSSKWKRVWSRKHAREFRFKLSFVTLTTPSLFSSTSAKKIKAELLQPWLSYARQMLGVNNYIWKMERAQSGMLHIHLTIDVFCEHWRIKKSWNRLMSKKGYLDQYEHEHGHANPNSVDIHSVYKCNNLAAELAKYMCKSDDQCTFIEGRLWGMSYDLSRATETKCEIGFQSDAYDSITVMGQLIKNKAVEITDKTTQIKKIVATIWLPSMSDWGAAVLQPLRETFMKTVASLRFGCSYNAAITNLYI